MICKSDDLITTSKGSTPVQHSENSETAVQWHSLK